MVDHDQTLLFGIWSRSKFEICFILFPSRCYVMTNFQGVSPKFWGKKVVCFMESWRLANSSIICHQYWRLWCSKYPKSQGISSILGAKYFKWMRFCWNAWMAGVSRVVGGECECLPSQFLRSTREKLLPCTKRCHEPWDGSCRFSLEILVGKSMAW